MFICVWCVCVEHLKRCKTSNLLVRFFENFVLVLVIKLSQQGGWLSMQVPAHRRGLHATLISLETSSDVPATLFL